MGDGETQGLIGKRAGSRTEVESPVRPAPIQYTDAAAVPHVVAAVCLPNRWRRC